MSTLTSHIDKFFRLLAGHGQVQLPLSSDEVRITESYPPTTELRTVPEYEARFDELLHAGYPWINLSCVGVHDGFLVLTVTLPSYPPTPRPPGYRTPVNFSGPSRADLARDWH